MGCQDSVRMEMSSEGLRWVKMSQDAFGFGPCHSDGYQLDPGTILQKARRWSLGGVINFHFSISFEPTERPPLVGEVSANFCG
jgi:hypothetical protein